MTANRKIIHIDMDAFYASIEQRDFPAYRGMPLVVGGRPDRRGVVAAASYEARQYGIRSAMSSYQAARRCPDLIFAPPRFEVYKQVSGQIREIFLDYADLVEPLSLDEAYLDVTENKKNNPSATWIAKEIKVRIREATGLTASAGISYNKFLAKIASDMDKPDGLYLIKPEDAPAFLERLPIGKFYGIGKVTARKMKELGIHTGADLKKWPLERLTETFGKTGAWYFGIVRGHDDREVSPERERKSLGAETTFDTDLCDTEEMMDELGKLADDVVEGLEKRGLRGRTLTLKVKYENFRQITRSRTVDTPVTGKALMLDLVRELLAQTEAGPRKVRLLGITVSNFETAPGSEAEEPAEADGIRQLRLDFGIAG